MIVQTSNNPDPEVVIDFENLCVCLFVSQETLQIINQLFGATLSWTKFVMGRNDHFPCSMTRHYQTSATFGGSDPNTPYGTRGHIGHQINQCVLF